MREIPCGKNARNKIKLVFDCLQVNAARELNSIWNGKENLSFTFFKFNQRFERSFALVFNNLQ